MELKSVGKIGMVKRKQFLQKKDFSRSHEVRKKKKSLDFKETERRKIDDIYCSI